MSGVVSYTQNFDIDLLRNINLNRNQSYDPSMVFVSKTEYVIGMGAPIGICAVALAKKDVKLLEKGVNMSFAVVLNTAATYALKRIVDRPRPAETHGFLTPLENESRFSFPSGHTSNAFCTATSLSLNFKKWYVIVPAYAWASTVGYSRLHMGVHYPSDVVAGALLGAGSAYVTYKVNKYLRKKYATKYEKWIKW